MHTYIVTPIWLLTKTHPTMCHKISAALSLPSLPSLILYFSMLWFILFSWWWQLWPGVTRAFNSTAVGAAANVWKTADDRTWKHLKTLYPDLSEPHTYQPTSATQMSPPHAHRCTHVQCKMRGRVQVLLIKLSVMWKEHVLALSFD